MVLKLTFESHFKDLIICKQLNDTIAIIALIILKFGDIRLLQNEATT